MKKDFDVKNIIGSVIKKPNQKEAITFLPDTVAALNKDYSNEPFMPKARYDTLYASVKSYIQMMKECVAQMNEYNSTHQDSPRIDMQNDLITTMLNNNGNSIIAAFKNITACAIEEAYQYYFMLVLQTSLAFFMQVMKNDKNYCPSTRDFDYIFGLSNCDCNMEYSGAALRIFNIPSNERYVLGNDIDGFINADPGYNDKSFASNDMSTPRQCAYNILLNHVLWPMYSISINDFMTKCSALMTYGGALQRILCLVSYKEDEYADEEFGQQLSYADMVDKFMTIVDHNIKAFYPAFSSNMMDIFNILGNASGCVFPGYELKPYLSPIGNPRSNIVSRIDSVPRDYTMDAVIGERKRTNTDNNDSTEFSF